MRLALFIAALCALAGSPAMAADEPSYTVVERHGDIEIRDYPGLIIAEVEVEGDRRAASNQGFRPLANYIFGGNQPSEEIAMTAPVTSTRAGQEIAMTAPVTSEPAGEGVWRVAFIMPDQWTMETLPAPNEDRVTLRETAPRRVAVIRFNGLMGESRIEAKLTELTAFMDANDLQAGSTPTYAAYNPPWIPAPFRRNEIWIEIS